MKLVEIGASDTLALCGDAPFWSIKDFLKMDLQFNAEQDHIEGIHSIEGVGGTPTLYHAMLATQAELVCTGKRLGLNGVTFPTDSRTYVDQGGYRTESGIAFTLAAEALGSGAAYMWRLLHEQEEASRLLPTFSLPA